MTPRAAAANLPRASGNWYETARRVWVCGLELTVYGLEGFGVVGLWFRFFCFSSFGFWVRVFELVVYGLAFGLRRWDSGFTKRFAEAVSTCCWGSNRLISPQPAS